MQADKTSQSIRTMVVALNDGEVTSYKLGGITVFALSGQCSHKMFKAFHQCAQNTAGSIGIDMSALKGIAPWVVPVLEKTRRHVEKRRRHIILYDPPARLMDILSLQGLKSRYMKEQNASVTADKSADGPDAQGAEKNIKRFMTNLRKNQAIDKGLENAEYRIASFMPKTLPSIPEYRFSAYCRACDRIGGDFYDFFPLNDHSLGITLGDVSGHGLPAAIVMGIAKKVLRLRALDMVEAAPADILKRVNGDLYTDLARGTFVTIFYGVLDFRSHEFVFARAGHEPPLHFARGKPRPDFIATTGMAVGIVPPAMFNRAIENCQIAVNPGDGLFMFSDGVFDAVNEKDVRFGKARMVESVSGIAPYAAIKTILTDLNEYSGNARQADDLTMVAFGRHGGTTVRKAQ